MFSVTSSLVTLIFTYKFWESQDIYHLPFPILCVLEFILFRYLFLIPTVSLPTVQYEARNQYRMHTLFSTRRSVLAGKPATECFAPTENNVALLHCWTHSSGLSSGI